MDLKNDLLGLKSQLESIEKGISEKINDASEKDLLIKRLDTKVNEIVEAKTVPLINLNIGGKIFQTKVQTLLSVPNTVFYNTIKKLQDEGKPLPEELFYDRSYTHFDIILNYLRYKIFSLKGYSRYDKEDVREEVEFYGLSEVIQFSKREEYEVEWDQALSKAGACTVDSNDRRLVRVHSNTCYTHFVTNKVWTNEDFQVELEVAVNQSDTYLYVGIYNSSYSLSGNCGCCNPSNCCYIQCDGSTHLNGARTNNTNAAWNSQKIILGMKVYLSESSKRMYFYFPERNDLELGPFTLTGSNFRIYAGHCNTGNGEIRILDCYALKE